MEKSTLGSLSRKAVIISVGHCPQVFWKFQQTVTQPGTMPTTVHPDMSEPCPISHRGRRPCHQTCWTTERQCSGSPHHVWSCKCFPYSSSYPTRQGDYHPHPTEEAWGGQVTCPGLLTQAQASSHQKAGFPECISFFMWLTLIPNSSLCPMART